MKKNYFKKTLLLVIAVLMVVSCVGLAMPMLADAAATDTTYRVATDIYGTPYWSPTDSNTRWMLWGESTDKSKAHLYIKVPKTIYLDKTETLQSAGYKIVAEWSLGSGTSYRIGIGPAVWGNGNGIYNQSGTEQFTMNNMFNDYSSNVSLHEGASNEQGVNGYNNTNKYDLRQGDSYDGSSGYIVAKNMGSTKNWVNNIYLIGTPKNTGTGRYSTTGINPSPFNFTQEWTWKQKWETKTSPLNATGKPTTVSEQLYGWNEVWWDVVIYDKSPLNLAINDAESKYSSNNNEYTDASWNAYQSALSNAKTVLKKREVTQGATDSTDTSTINGAKNALATAIAGLVKQYKITWKNWDDTEIKSEYFAINTTPKYSGTTPTKPGEGVEYNGKQQFTYNFIGWDPAITPATKDATYTAQFEKVANFYFVTYDFADSREDLIKIYTPGSTIPTNDIPKFSTKDSDATYHYSYKWDKAFATVTADVTYTETLVTEKHSYGNWTTVDGKAPTCSADGRKERICSECKYRQETDDTERPNHEIEKVKDYKDSTCTEVGNITYYKCKNCNTLFKDEAGKTKVELADTIIAKKDHEYKVVVRKEGDKDYHYLKCESCDDKITGQHGYVELPGATATCSVKGSVKYACPCGETNEIFGETDPDNHVNTTTVKETPATCLKPGVTESKYCKDCQKTISGGETIPQLNHDYSGATKNNGDGTHSYLCVNGCNEYGSAVSCSNWVEGNGKCQCSECGYTKEHAWGTAWTPAEDNTATAPGKMTHICNDCKATETVACTDYKEVNRTDATCEAAEVIKYECSACGHTYEKTGEPATDHNFNGAYVSKNNGTHVQKCTNAGCNAEGNEQNCTYGAWSTDNATNHSHTCTACGYTPAAENHDFTKWTHNDENTGNMTRNCKVCGRVESTKCQYTEVYTSATCVDNAFTTYTCTYCGHGYTVIHTGTVLGHDFTGAYKYDTTADKHQQLCARTDCGAYGVGTEADVWADCSWSYKNIEAGKHTASCVCGNSEEQSCSGGQATCAAQAVCQHCETAYGEKSEHSFKGDVVVLEGDFHAYRCEYCKDQTIYGVGSKENEKEPCSGGTATCTSLAVCGTCGDTHGQLDANAHKWGAPASNNDSKHTHTYTCEYNSEHEKIEDCIPAVDHIVAPTCEEAGYTVQKCTACSVTWNTDPVGALDHEWGAWANNGNGTHTKACVRPGCCYGENGTAKTQTASCTKENATVVVTAPTCTEKGYSTYTCKDCGYVWVADEVSAKGHDYTRKIYKEEYLHLPQDCVNPNIYFYACLSCGKNGKDETDTNKYTNLTFEADKPLGHTWVEKIADEYKISDATCTTAAKYYKSCSVCSIKSEESFTVTEAFGHSNWVKPTAEEIEARKELLAVKADCETDAQYYYVCELCRVSSKGLKTDGETWTVVSDKPGHSTFVEVKGVVGNCENDTIIAHYYCSACGKKFKDADGNEAFVGATVIKAPGHSWVKYKAVDATCETDGHDAYDKCSVCDVVKGSTVTYPKTGHNFTADAGYFVDEVNDYHAFYCANAKCLPATDDNGEAVKDAKGRSVYNKAYGIVVDGVQVKYAVTDDEVVGGIQCSFDSSTITTVNGVHSHNNVCVCGNARSEVFTCENPEVVAPKCADNGYTLHTCPECKATWKTDIVAATGHTMSATGQSNGDGTHSIQCTVENCGYKKDTVKCQGGTATCKVQAVCEICNGAYGDTLPHTLDGEWTYNNDAKCGRDGTESQNCSVCNEPVTRTKAGSALNHVYLPEYTYDISNWTNRPDDFNLTLKKPDCKENGLAINYCTNEDCSHYNIKTIQASSAYHKFSVTTTAGTCTTGSVTIKTCTVCNYTEKTVSEAGDHKWSETGRDLPDCTNSGSIYYVCTACEETAELNIITADFTDSDYVIFKGMKVDISGIKAKGHQWGNLAIEREATCSREGKAKHTCQVEGCGKEETVTLKVIEGAHIIGHQNSTLKKVPASEPTCVLSGNREYYECMSCPYSQNANNEYYLKPLAHSDKDGDGRCDNCYDPMGSAPVIDDGCICHKSGFSAFIYKILRVFWKLFKIKKSCDCGAVHY